MTTTTEIKNMSLAHIGVGTDIGSATNEDSPSKAVTDLFFPRVLNEMLRRHQWGFATVFEDLELIIECPNSIYNFAYGYPNDCLFFQKILSEVRNDDRKTRVPFRRGRTKNSAGERVQVIFSDKVDPVGQFTEKLAFDSDFDDDFAIAASFRLAYFIAPRLTGGDPFQKQRAALENYRVEFHNAVRQDMRERQDDVEPESPYVKARRRRGRSKASLGNEIFPSNTVIS